MHAVPAFAIALTLALGCSLTRSTDEYNAGGGGTQSASGGAGAMSGGSGGASGGAAAAGAGAGGSSGGGSGGSSGGSGSPAGGGAAGSGSGTGIGGSSGASGAPGVVCGADVCTGTQACCINDAISQCTDEPSDCSSDAILFFCDGPEDCDGRLCCAVSPRTVCQESCPGPRVCHNDGDCAGQKCKGAGSIRLCG